MSLQPASVQIGPFKLAVTDQGNGVFEASISLNAEVGGGSAAGVMVFGGSLFANLNAEQVMALGFAELNKVIPATILPAAEAGEAIAESELKQV